MDEKSMITRRDWVASLARTVGAGFAIGVFLPGLSRAATVASSTVTVYKDPSCGCCTKWVAHLRAAGMHPLVHDRSDMDALKDSLAIPAALRSCHTAVAGRFVIEGHVPAEDLKRLLATAPRGVVGIAVPNMPAGSPGMEMAGRVDPYDVIAFATDGSTKLFARH
jgi:hypothetical protein